MSAEVTARFACFGGSCTVIVGGTSGSVHAPEAVLQAKRRLLAWHDQFSRFNADSELSRLNRDPRETVPVSEVMSHFVATALAAAQLTGGLVDPTLVGELEDAGYRDSRPPSSGPLPGRVARRPASPRTAGQGPAGPRSPAATWRRISVDPRAATVTRPAGVRLDSGGIVKGMFGDVLSCELRRHESFAVDAAGDVRFGGTGGLPRPIRVASPFDGSCLHVFERVDGAAATSGISRRSWTSPDGSPAHHLLDPATGRPAFTGVVQATALAPTAAEAEALSKAALLSGPDAAASWLRHGGVIVADDGGAEVIEAGASRPSILEPVGAQRR